MNDLSIKNLAALIIGNALEWYDFVVYSFISIYFAKIFFPSADPVNTILAATATFGVALLMRPLGGLILGWYADHYGRLRAMNVIILMMAASLLIIVCAPTYQQAGIYAPLLILLARLLQGFSAGAEFGVSSCILFEISPEDQRGLYSSLQTFGQMIGILFSSVIGVLLTSSLNPEQIEHWGWRIPFIIGLVIIPVGIYIRRHIKEPAATTVSNAQYPLIQTIKANLKSIFIVIGLVSGGTVAIYIVTFYMPIYVTRYLSLTAHDAYLSIMIGASMMAVLIPIFGKISDRVGRKSLLFVSMILYFAALYPCFAWLNAAPSLLRLISIQSIFCFLLAIYYGSITAAMTELFPRQIRSMCLSIGFNIGVVLFGAFAQFIVTLLLEKFATPMAIIIYPLVGIGICIVAICCYPAPAPMRKIQRGPHGGELCHYLINSPP